jgi:hypothetical protein
MLHYHAPPPFPGSVIQGLDIKATQCSPGIQTIVHDRQVKGLPPNRPASHADDKENMEELGPPGQHRGRPRREVWTTTTLVTLILVVCSFWIPKSNAATLPSRVLAPRDQIAEGVELRVLPIGE